MKRSLVLVTAVSLLAGCAAAQPPRELVDARAAYQRAAQGPAAQVDPVAVHKAQESLGIAERWFDDHGDAQSTRDLAYAAMRKAQLAEAEAQVKLATQQKTSAQNEVQLTQADALKTAQGELQRDRQEIATEQSQLREETRRRQEAEKRAQQAAQDLAAIAQVKQEPRGMVITLSGSVLFASGKSTLLPEAMAKLSEVAQSLTQQDPDSKIRVEGYTDSQGSTSFNQTLSQQRADAVRTYLVQHGIAADRITAVGKGPDDPVASNMTAEGRADNRRVEIVVQPPGQTGTTNGGTP